MVDELSAGLTAIVFAGGEPPHDAILDRLPEPDLIVAADSGLDRARAWGLHVDIVVGDLDSVDPVGLDAATSDGTAVELHPAEKDATDLELAIASAAAHGAQHVIVVGGYGGRLDHFVANVELLASPRFRELQIEAWVGDAHVTVVHERTELHGRIDSLCSLLAVGGMARGVTTQGLRYPLHDDELLPGSTRGVSNELTAPVATVSLHTGVVLAIQPNALDHQEGGVR
jgi:thiamine pyrophosphokinase